MGLIFFIICGVITLGIIFYNTKRTRYTKWYKEGKPCLSFEEFISFYNVNPDRWKITEEWDWDDEGVYNLLLYYTQEGKLVFGWKTNHDRADYLEWVENKKRYEQDMKTAEVLAKLTKNVRKDVEFYNNKAQQQAQETYDRILKMMEEE